MKTVWATFQQLAAQKKFQAAVISGLAWLAGKAGWHASTADLVPMVGPLWLYIFGQGLADFGKSAAEATAATTATPSAAPAPAAPAAPAATP